ncbi:MAG TPA: metal-dependent transcriptional regulator [Microbacteriaceae bacterium]|nr:metal-dependent transcriptional regulator [Microbacteriaceae bacterium]
MSEITPTAEDYVKAIWSATEWGEPAITTKGLAARFGTTSATASDTIRRLVLQGLVEHEPYGQIGLTPTGVRHALAMVRRHRLIETFLASTLGYSWAEIHDEAERLEHAASDLLIDRVDALLDHPAHDPHGDPIPAADGRVSYPQGAVSVRRAEPGDYVIVRISDADAERLVYFHEHGLVPGAAARVVGHDLHASTVRLRVGGSTGAGKAASAELALAGEATDAIILAPAGPAGESAPAPETPTH